ncbi:uncharacterized protein [Antedon mediterranea]|uniref:uncharacterized protein n=1 Tax=Antedon mediterranea TaxID=105859 RepID=UPI003AF978BA
MVEPAVVVSSTLAVVRRNRKGALTRSLKSLEALMAVDAENETVYERYEKSKQQWEAVEAAHQELVDTLKEDEAFEREEAWMIEAEAVFVAARVQVEKYLTSQLVT